MKLISCYIENFGKISKFTYDFNDQLNIIEKENGWGKTTFAAFIKSMFYGLEYTRKRVIVDRKRYMPWNGNKFGGYIIIERDGIKYKIQRFFGKTDKDDTLMVYDMSKNIISNDLGENPGEEIWKIDRESYEKTAFITLDDSGLLNDIISSKLGNIEDQEVDMEASTYAINLLECELVKLKAKRGNGGILGDKKNLLIKLKQELRQAYSSLSTVQQTEEWIGTEEKELFKIEDKIAQIEESQSKLLLYEKKQQYLNLIEDFESKTNDHREIEEFFKGKKLSEENLNIIKDEVARYVNKKEETEKNKLSEIEQNELEELSHRFRGNLVKIFEIEDCNEKITLLSNQRTELKNYDMNSEDKNRFNNLDNKYININLDENIIEGYLNDLNNISELAIEENNINIEIGKSIEQHQDNSNIEKDKKARPLLFIGIGISLLGALMTFVSLLTKISTIISGLVVVIIYKLFNSKNVKNDQSIQRNNEIEILKQRLEEIDKKRNELKSGYISFLHKLNENPENITLFLANSKAEIIEYKRLKKEISNNLLNAEEIENKIYKLKQEIEKFLSKYFNISIINDYEKSLLDLRKSLSRFEELSKQDQLYKTAKGLSEKSKEILSEKFKYYYDEFPSDVISAEKELTKVYYDLKTSKSKLDDSKSSKEKFELDNNILALGKITLADIKNNQLIEELNKQRNYLNKEKDKVIKKIERFKKDIDLLIQEADNIEDIESTIAQSELDIEVLEHKYSLIDLTRECMIQAKENLATKYMGNMSQTFEKYINLLNSENINLYQMDINLDVKIQHEGELYDSEQLSRGTKDLVQICMRMALVEAVYKDVEKPILILDDPFVNLDNNRLENSTILLKKISKEYQIIYFICHNSRNIA